MRVKGEFKRVRYLWPGKHGARDLRVEFCRRPPTHGEIVAIVGGVFLAEGRYYDGPGELGSRMLLRYLERAARAKTVDEVLRLAAEADATTERARAEESWASLWGEAA